MFYAIHGLGGNAFQEAEAHQQLTATRIEVASRAIGLLDWLLESTPDGDARSCVELDDAIHAVERVRERLL